MLWGVIPWPHLPLADSHDRRTAVVRLLDALKTNGLNTASAPVFVQCFEVEPLKTFHKLGGRARRVMLVAQGPAPVDVKSAAGIKALPIAQLNSAPWVERLTVSSRPQ